jgi:hypothetical protein
MNPSKAKGTAAESAVVRVARANGFPLAERRALAGSADVGDILLCPGVIIEVKAGKAAKTASLAQIGKWLAETETERRNADAEVGLLVTQRQGIGVDRAGLWEAWVHADMIFDDGWDNTVLMLTLTDALLHLRKMGWGDKL